MSATRTEARDRAVATAPPVRYSLGLDLGKMSDPTALAVVEEQPERMERDRRTGHTWPVWSPDPEYRATWLERWVLQTPYHSIAEAVAVRYAALTALPGATVALYVDGTGVGTAVTEILGAQPILKAGTMHTITLTAGREVTRVAGGWHVAKGELVSVAQVALQRGKLAVSPQLPEAATLRDELGTFEVRLTDAANAVFEHRTGRHDDLVLAVSLALWGARRPQPRRSTFRSSVTY